MNCQLCYQPVTIENYLSPTHKDHCALRKYEQPLRVFNFQHSSPESLQSHSTAFDFESFTPT